MDSRYRDRGYSATLMEDAYGAFLTIKRNEVVVGEVAVGVFEGGPDEPVSIIIKRFRPNELRKVNEIDDFD
jgi:hypothetical protein